MTPSTPARRLRRAAIVLLTLAALLSAAGLWWKPRAEAWLRARLEREASRRGWQASFEDVRVGLVYPVSLRGARLQKAGVVVDVESLKVPLRPGLLLGRARLELGRVRVGLPHELVLEVVPTLWELPWRPAQGGRVELLEEGARLEAEWHELAATRGRRFELRLDQAPLGRLVEVTRDGQRLLDAGVASGHLEGRQAGADAALQLKLDLSATGLRAAPLSARENLSDDPPLGPPISLALEIEGHWQPGGDEVELKRWSARSDGLRLAGSLSLADLHAAARLTLHLDVAELDFAKVLASAGLEAPQALAESGGGDLGAASLELRAAGLLADPASFEVTQKIDFRPPTRRLAALERLRGDFVHEVVGRDGARISILVTPGSPDYVALQDVPPLFVRTLLLGEDAGYFGHRGVDLRELPAAVLTNLARGKAARGASTITQQLAKNLFLSRDKVMGRKLQEACLALLIEATLDKQRILEIYLNVIEWGPGLYGLRPAARHYFAREPAQLTPAQMAFLVALIPGPVRYQSAFAAGRPSSGFRPMMDTLLARLRSVEALDEQQYQAALAEDVLVASARPSAEPEAQPDAGQ